MESRLEDTFLHIQDFDSVLVGFLGYDEQKQALANQSQYSFEIYWGWG